MRQPLVRTPHRAARGLIAAAAIALLVGCGTTDRLVSPSPSTERPDQTATAGQSGQPGQPGQSAATPSATNTPADSTGTEPAHTPVSHTIVCDPHGSAPKPFTGPAVAQFGEDAVMDAYCETAAFFVQHAVTNLTDPAATDPRTAQRDLRFVQERLSVVAAQRWSRSAASAATSTKAEQALRDLTFYRLTLPRGYAYPQEGPMAVGGEVSEAVADVVTLADGRSALALWYSVSINLPVAHTSGARATHTIALDRDVALYLVPNPDTKAPADRSWDIEAWTSTWATGPAKAWSSGR